MFPTVGKNAIKKILSFFIASLLALLVCVTLVPALNKAGASDTSFKVTYKDANKVSANANNPDANFATGILTVQSVSDFSEEDPPEYTNYLFARAYIADSTRTGAQNPLEIKTAQRVGDKIIVTSVARSQDDDDITLYIDAEGSEKKIVFEYIPDNQVSYLKYESVVPSELNKSDVDVAGPSHIGLTYDRTSQKYSGNVNITVTLPRDYYPEVRVRERGSTATVSPATNGSDVSSPEKTIINYTLNITKGNKTIEVKAIKRSDTVTVTFDTTRKDDWYDGQSPSYGDTKRLFRYENSSGQNVTVNAESRNGTAAKKWVASGINRKEDFEFYIYRDLGLNISSGGVRLAKNSSLVALWSGNEMIAAAPQPLARYGASMYTGYDLFGANPPTYTEFSGSSAKARWFVFFAPLLLSTFIPMYSQDFGYDTVQGSNWANGKTGGTSETSKGTVVDWYKEAILGKLVGQYTQSTIEHGARAGMTTRIEIVDAKPINYKGTLGKAEDPENVDLSQFTNDNTSNWTDNNKSYAKSNILRIAYKVTVSNISHDLIVDTEWASSDQIKAAIYRTHGLESYDVYQASGGYVRADSTVYLTAQKIQGTKTSSGLVPVTNSDPKLPVRARIQNGYTDPVFHDYSWVYNHGGIYKDAPTELTCEYISGEQYCADPKYPMGPNATKNAVEGTYPLFSVGGDVIQRENGRATVMSTYGGMNILGITADPYEIPVWYDLDGGTAPRGTERDFANRTAAEQDSSFRYDVERHPLIHIPSFRPVKKARLLTGWTVWYVDMDGVHHNTGNTVGVASQWRIDDNATLGSKLTDATGKRLVQGFYFKANYLMNSGAREYNAEYHDVDDDTTIKLTQFIGIKGINAHYSADAVPESFEQDGVTYYRYMINEYGWPLLQEEINEKYLTVNALPDDDPGAEIVETDKKVFIFPYTKLLPPLPGETVVKVRTGTKKGTGKDARYSLPAKSDWAKQSIENGEQMPEGTVFEFVNRENDQWVPYDPSTDTPGVYTIYTRVTYPNGTQRTILTNLRVISMAESWSEEKDPPTAQGITLNWGSEPYNDFASLLVRDENLPVIVNEIRVDSEGNYLDNEGNIIPADTLPATISATRIVQTEAEWKEVKTQPVVDTIPKAGGHDQDIAIVLTFPDNSTITIPDINNPGQDKCADETCSFGGSIIEVPVKVTIRKAAETNEPEGRLVYMPDYQWSDSGIKITPEFSNDLARIAVSNSDSLPLNLSGREIPKPMNYEWTGQLSRATDGVVYNNGNQNVNLRVTYPDDSYDDMLAQVTVLTTRVLIVGRGSIPDEQLARVALGDVVNDFPEGTTFEWKNYDTSKDNAPATIRIIFPEDYYQPSFEIGTSLITRGYEEVSLRKEDGKGNPLANARFKICAATTDGQRALSLGDSLAAPDSEPDYCAVARDTDGTAYDDLVSDENGHIGAESISIPAGDWVLVELEAPQNYLLGEPLHFVLPENSTEVPVVIYRNHYDETALTQLLIEKWGYSGRDGDSQPLPGSRFALYEDSGSGPSTVIDEDLPDANTDSAATKTTSLFIASDLRKDSCYWLVETQAPDGHALLALPVKICFSLDASSELVVTVPTSSDSKEFFIEVAPPVNDVPKVIVRDIEMGVLPLNGGPGIYPYIVGGLFIICAAYVISGRSLSASRRSSQ